MIQEEFEKQLANKIFKGRLITGLVCAGFLVMFIASWILIEATKETIVYGGPAPLPTWEREEYNMALIPFIAVGIVGAVYCGVQLVMDFITCGFRTVQKDGQCITVYRGTTHYAVYVDGVEKGRIGPFSYHHVVEVWLENRVRATVSFSRTIWYIAHISFSDQTTSIEV